MEERRRFVRLPGPFEIRCAVLPSGTMQATRAKDLSAGGACLMTDAPLPSNTQLQMAIQLPERSEPVNAIGEAVWSETVEMTGKTQHQRHVETGVRFAEIAPQDHEVLLECIARSLRALQS